jgi:hypothetical protein
MLDINVTQGSYWNGSQIPYWVYMILTILPFTGLLGLDHLVLRSPITAILKTLSIIPLFGFWYFYDIAQSTGERELVEKYGIGVPLYGPTGIGAGIFNSPKIKEAPPESPRPWRYMLYAITTYISVFFPINKLILGDYKGAIAHFIMLVIFPLTFLAIIWGFYDIFRIIFDTRGIFDMGPARFFPASWLLAPYFDRSVLGPQPISPTSGILNTIERVGKLAVDATLGTGEVLVEGTHQVIKGTAGAVTDTINKTAGDVREVVDTTTGVANNIVTSTGDSIEAITDSIGKGSKPVGNIVGLLEKIPEITNKMESTLAKNIVQEAKMDTVMSNVDTSQVLNHSGGGLQSPSISTVALLFSVGILAFSGYVFYTMRNSLRASREKSDDPPGNSTTVRESSKTSNSRG